MGVILPYPSSVFVELQRRTKRKAEIEEQRRHERRLASIMSSNNSSGKTVNITVHNHYNNPKKHNHKKKDVNKNKCINVIQFIN